MSGEIFSFWNCSCRELWTSQNDEVPTTLTLFPSKVNGATFEISKYECTFWQHYFLNRPVRSVDRVYKHHVAVRLPLMPISNCRFYVLSCNLYSVIWCIWYGPSESEKKTFIYRDPLTGLRSRVMPILFLPSTSISCTSLWIKASAKWLYCIVL